MTARGNRRARRQAQPWCAMADGNQGTQQQGNVDGNDVMVVVEDQEPYNSDTMWRRNC